MNYFLNSSERKIVHKKSEIKKKLCEKSQKKKQTFVLSTWTDKKSFSSFSFIFIFISNQNQFFSTKIIYKVIFYQKVKKKTGKHFEIVFGHQSKYRIKEKFYFYILFLLRQWTVNQKSIFFFIFETRPKKAIWMIINICVQK